MSSCANSSAIFSGVWGRVNTSERPVWEFIVQVTNRLIVFSLLWIFRELLFFHAFYVDLGDFDGPSVALVDAAVGARC